LYPQSSRAPVSPAVLSVPAPFQGKVSRIACGAQHILATLKDGTSVAWGDPADDKTKVPLAAAAKGATMSMSAGDHFSLWLLKNGTVLKAGKLPGVKTVIVPLSEPAKAIAAGRSHGVAILARSAVVVVFGDSTWGQGSIPAHVNANKPVTLIAAGDECSIALTSKGLVAWGGGGEFDACSVKPPFPKGFTSFTTLMAAGVRTEDEARVRYTAQLTNGSWVAWPSLGYPDFVARNGQGKSVASLVPYGDNLLAVVEQKSAGAGGGGTGVTVLESWPLTNLPSPAVLNAVPKSFCTRYPVAFAVTLNGRVEVWGRTGSESAVLAAQPPAQLQGKVGSVACGRSHTAAILKAGQGAAAWGGENSHRNQYGELDVPAAARAPATVSAVGAGSMFSVYLVNGNVLQAGVMEGPSTRPLPAEVESASGRIVDVAAGKDCAAALTTDGRVAAWGSAYYPCQRVPASIATGSSKAKQVAAGASHIVALLEGGRVLQWGGDSANPVPQPPAAAAAGVTAVAAGDGYTLAIKDGKTFMWGNIQCKSSVPAAALAPKASCGISAADTHALIRLCNGKGTPHFPLRFCVMMAGLLVVQAVYRGSNTITALCMHAQPTTNQRAG
jgi:hypothetical protein